MQVAMHHIDMETTPSIWSLGYFSLFFCAVISAVLVLFYLHIIKPFVFLPADILMWAETDFVGNIIKFRIGAPIYTPPEDNNSLVYTPAAPLLTYAISWLVGKPTSIVAWRVIQLGFIFCATLVATACCRMLYKLAYPDHRIFFPKTWLVFTFFAMFLAATAPITNSFAHCLHADALALLVSMFSFWTMLLYLRSPSWKYIILMAVCPTIGFLTKQNLLSWFAVMFAFLLLYNPKEIKRLVLFSASAATFVAIAIGVCYLLWGDAFIFWVLKIGGGRKISFTPDSFNISLARSLDHTIRVWMEIAIGVVGGLLILQGRNIRKLGPLWVAWVVLISIEAITSSTPGGRLYLFGPGIVIGTIWLFSTLPKFWPFAKVSKNSDSSLLIYDLMKPLIAVAGIMTIFIALHVVPTGDKKEARYYQRHPSSDAYRYISDIEREFEDLSADKVLLDIGNWIYLRHSVLAKDRAISLADQPPAGIYENINVMVNRIRKKTYAKILVRDLHSPFFFYDWVYWKRPSGVRKALMKHYTEVRTIPAVKGDTLLPPIIMHTGPVSVLIPKPD